MKACPCGLVHSAESFAALELKGWVGVCWSSGVYVAAEIRNCTCGSTIAIEVVAPKKIRRANELHARPADSRSLPRSGESVASDEAAAS